MSYDQLTILKILRLIFLFCLSGYAKLIEFNPLRTTDVLLPDCAVFMVLNSMIIANKAAFESFNVRVVEGRIGTLVRISSF